MEEFATSRLDIERNEWRRDHPFGFIARPASNERGGMDLKHWDCYIPGPAKTRWEGGLYKLEVTFPDCYPVKPPKCRFTAPLFHPNVSAGGLVSTSDWEAGMMLSWNPSTTLKEVLVQIQRLLGEPDMQIFVNTEAWQMAVTDPRGYACRAYMHAVEFAERRVHEELQRRGQ